MKPDHPGGGETLGGWGRGVGGGVAQQAVKQDQMLQSSASLQSVGGRSAQQQWGGGGLVSNSRPDTVPGSPEIGPGSSMIRRNVRIVNPFICLDAAVYFILK